MRTMTGDRAATEIRRAYGTWRTQGGTGWMPTRELFTRTDLSLDEATAGVRHLTRASEGFIAAPDPARGAWTGEDQATQIPFGGETVGLLIWQD